MAPSPLEALPVGDPDLNPAREAALDLIGQLPLTSEEWDRLYRLAFLVKGVPGLDILGMLRIALGSGPVEEDA